MAETVIAAPVNPNVIIPEGMTTTLFDWQPIPPLFGFPLWFYIAFFLIIIAISVAVFWILKKAKLNPVLGWYIAKQTQTIEEKMVWVLTRFQSLDIINMKHEDDVLSFHDKTRVGMWHHNSQMAVIKVGGVPGVIASESYDQTRDPMSEIALTVNCKAFNEDQENLKQFKEENQLNGKLVVAPINNFEDYETHGRTSLETINPEGLKIAMYNVFSNIDFMKFFPMGNKHMHFGAELRRKAKDMAPRKKKEDFWDKYAFILGALSVGVLIMILGAFAPIPGA